MDTAWMKNAHLIRFRQETVRKFLFPNRRYPLKYLINMGMASRQICFR